MIKETSTDWKKITELQVLAHTQQIFNQPKLSTRLSRSELKTNQLRDKQKQIETDDTQ